MTRNLDNWITGKNSCEFDLNKGEKGGIRVKILGDYIYVDKREANGETRYTKCIINQIRDPVFKNMAIVSNNRYQDDRVSEIEIDAIQFRNLDSSVY